MEGPAGKARLQQEFVESAAGASTRPPRVLVLSCRNVRHTLFNSALHEFEDLVARLEGATVFAPTRYHGDRRFDLARNTARAARAARLGRARAAVPFPCEFRPDHDYDLLFAVFDNPWDFDLVELVAEVGTRCGKVVGYLPEVWAQTFDSRTFRYENFGLFDQFFVGTWHDVDTFQAVSGVPTAPFAPAVDALRFAPLDQRPERVVEVTNLGRRSPVTHAALLERARGGPFYLYDDIANGDFVDPVAHRDWLADVMRRSRYVIANHARCDRLDLTRGTKEMGYRHPEGAAAGTVMLGDPPTTPMAAEYLGWQDAVVALPVDAPDIADTIADLDRDPARTDAIRARNMAGALRLNDWAHRWAQVLAAVGIPPTQALADRRGTLHELADRLDP